MKPGREKEELSQSLDASTHGKETDLETQETDVLLGLLHGLTDAQCIFKENGFYCLVPCK